MKVEKTWATYIIYIIISIVLGYLMFFWFPPPDPRLRPTHEVIQDGADAIEQNISHFCQTCESWILQNPGFWSRTSGSNLDLKKNKGPVGQGMEKFPNNKCNEDFPFLGKVASKFPVSGVFDITHWNNIILSWS